MLFGSLRSGVKESQSQKVHVWKGLTTAVNSVDVELILQLTFRYLIFTSTVYISSKSYAILDIYHGYFHDSQGCNVTTIIHNWAC